MASHSASSDGACGRWAWRWVTPKSRHHRMPTLEFPHCLPLGPPHRLRHSQDLRAARLRRGLDLGSHGASVPSPQGHGRVRVPRVTVCHMHMHLYGYAHVHACARSSAMLSRSTSGASHWSSISPATVCGYHTHAIWYAHGMHILSCTQASPLFACSSSLSGYIRT